MRNANKRATLFNGKIALVLIAIIALAGSLTWAGLADTVMLNLPANLTKVEAQAFMNDSLISDVVVPASVESIGAEAFKACSSLKRVKLMGLNTVIADNAFEGVADLCVSCVPGGKVEEFALSKGYEIDYITNPNGLAVSAPSPEKATVGVRDEIKWTVAQPTGGAAPYTYYYKVYFGDALTDYSAARAALNEYVFEPQEMGEYTLRVYVVDAEGRVETAVGGNVTVGEEFRIVLNQYINTIYTDEINEYMVGTARLETDIELMPSEIKWNIERVLGDPQNPVDIGVDYVSDNGKDADLYLRDEVDKNHIGELTWRLSVSAKEGAYQCERYFTMNMDQLPANLPTSIALPYTEYNMSLDGTLELDLGDIHFADNIVNLPANVIVRFSYWFDIEGRGTSEINDNILKLTFNENGRYTIEAAIGFNTYKLKQNITVIVGGGVRNPAVTKEQRSDTVYCNACNQTHIGNVYLKDFDILSGDNVEWIITPDAANPQDGAYLYASDYWDEMHGVSLNIDNVSTQFCGAYKWTVRVVVNGVQYGEAQEFAVNVVSDEPDNLPTGAKVTKNAITAQVGEEIEIVYSDIEFVGGNAPDGVTVWREYWYELKEGDEAREENGSQFLKFAEPGRYQIDAVIGFNSFMVKTPIIVTVGSGVREPELIAEMRSTEVYANDYDMRYMGSVILDNYDVLESDDVEWILTPDAGNGDNPAELTCSSNDDSKFVGNMEIENVSAEHTGTLSWDVSVKVNGAQIGDSVKITVNVLANAPEGVPTRATFSTNEYNLNVGDVLTLRYEDIMFADGTVPVGAKIWREFWYDLEGCGDDWEDEDGNLCIRFYNEGRYQFEGVIGFNSFMRTVKFDVYVGDVKGGFKLEGEQRFTTYYADKLTNDFVAEFWMENARLFDDDDVEWTITRVFPEGTNDPAKLRMDIYDDGRFGALYLKDVDPAYEGKVTWKLSVTAADELYVGSKEFSINIVANAPDGAPSGAKVETTEYNIAVGKTIDFMYTDLTFLNGTPGEGDDVWKEYWIDTRGRECDWWSDVNGHHIRFDEAGRYQINAEIGIGSDSYTVLIFVTVGGGVNPNYEISKNTRTEIVYLDAQDNDHIGNLYMENADFVEGDDVPEWEIVPGGSGANYPTLEYDTWDNGSGANFYVREVSALGVYTWTVNVSAVNGLYTGTKTFTVKVTNLNEDHPTGVTVPKNKYVLQEGDELVLDYSMDFTGGSVPDGVEVIRDYWFDFQGKAEDWDEDGKKHIVFPKRGRYVIHAVMSYGSFVKHACIEVIVGDGYYANWVDKTDTMYAEAMDDNLIASVYIDNLYFLDGERIEWTIEPIGDHGGNPAKLEAEGFWDDSRCVDLRLNDVDENRLADGLMWRVTYNVVGSDITGSREYTVNIVKLPENAPTGAYLRSNIYEYSWIVNDTLILEYDNIQFVDGNVPAGVDVWRKYDCDLRDDGEVWDDEDGLRNIRFDNEGVYRIDARIGFGSFCKSVPIFVFVGSEYDQICLEKYQRCDTLYRDLYNNDEGAYIGNVEIRNADQIFYSDDITVNILPDAGNNDKAELYVCDEWNDGRSLNFRLRNLAAGFTGNLTWKVTVEAGGLLMEEEFTVNVVSDTPAEVPAGIKVTTDKYTIDVNGEVVLDYNINFVDDKGIDDSKFWREYWFDFGDRAREEWTDEDEHKIIFNQEGRYQIKAVIGYNNYHLEKTITVEVGSKQEMDMNVDRFCYDVYADCIEHGNVANIYLNNLDLFDGEEIHWTCVPTGDHGENPAELHITGQWENWRGVNLEVSNVDGNYTGEVTWTITASIVGEYGYYADQSMDITLNIVERIPDNRPTLVDISFDSYIIGVDEQLTLNIADISFGDGKVPEGANVWKKYWCDTKGRGDAWQEGNDVFCFRFNDEGRFVIEAAIGYNSFVLRKAIVVTVGDGISDSFDIEQYVRANTVYVNTGDTPHIGNAQLINADVLDGETIDWIITNVGDHTDNEPEFFIDNNWDNWRGVNVHVRNIPDGYTGTLTWRLSVTAAGNRYNKYVDFTVAFGVSVPSDAPIAATVSTDNYAVKTGEILRLVYDDIRFATDYEPDGAEIWRDYWMSDGEQWEEEGDKLVCFQQAGTYQIDAVIGFNTYVVHKTITVNVGDVGE